jgi:hypothetical protein
VRVWERRVTEILEAGGAVVTTDLRFPDEEEYVRELGGTIIRIQRPGKGLSDPHPSEAFVAKMTPDYDFMNAFPDLTSLHTTVRSVARQRLNLTPLEDAA